MKEFPPLKSSHSPIGNNKAEHWKQYDRLCWGLTTRQPLLVILTRSLDRGRKDQR